MTLAPNGAGSGNSGVAVVDAEVGATVLDAYRRQYDDYASTWDHIDSKAANCITVAGVLTAACTAFLDLKSVSLGRAGVVLSILAIVCFVIAILLAVLSMWPRSVTQCPSGEDVRALVRSLPPSAAAASAEAYRARLAVEHARLYEQPIADLEAAVTVKARGLIASHVALFLGTLFVILISTRYLFVPALK